MKEKIEAIIREIGVSEVEAILNELKSKVNVVKENLKKDFVDLLTGCTISLLNDDIEYVKDGKLLFFYQKKDNYFNVIYSIWYDFEEKYNLNYKELKELLVGVIEEVLNYKGVTPIENILNYKCVTSN